MCIQYNEKLAIASYVRGARTPAERADWVLKDPSALGKSDIVEIAMTFEADKYVR